MPQMAPMSWLMLFMFFTVSLIVMATMNYYLFIPKMEKMEKEHSDSSKMMIWKW
uniref:ATP synthase complex subunit 8 n=1 Tax=Paracercion v-nigrum TaxID=1389458 RepID=A0A650FGU7_9ODON|nr:ATP synthase F0 subunit 8 [Paracercion v-nigrum]